MTTWPRHGFQLLSELPLKSGETLIVQSVEPVEAQGVVLRRIIEADNSCLFNSFGYVKEKRRDQVGRWAEDGRLRP